MLMAAASTDLPAIMVTGGPMLNGKFRGADVGSGTQVWRFEQELVAGRMTQDRPGVDLGEPAAGGVLRNRLARALSDPTLVGRCPGV